MRIARIERADGSRCLAQVNPDGTMLRLEGGLFDNPRPTEEPVHGRLLAPLIPTAILCTGLNYREHARETGREEPKYPVLFMKTPSSVQDPDAPIRLPRHLASHAVDYECELAVVIGARCRNATPANALDHVLGYTCANDVSARDWQGHRGGTQWCRAKTFDTFCPLGPWIVTPDDLPDPGALAISTRLNDRLMQQANTSDMIHGAAELIAFYSGDTTLEPGTVILTGTPHGVGVARNPPVWLQPGDTVTISITGIGDLTNPVVAG